MRITHFTYDFRNLTAIGVFQPFAKWSCVARGLRVYQVAGKNSERLLRDSEKPHKSEEKKNLVYILSNFKK